MSSFETPLGHDDYACNHCGADVRTHSDEQLSRHSQAEPHYRIARRDALSKALKLNLTVKDTAASMPGGKLEQSDMKHLMGRDNPKDDPFELPEFMK